MRRDRASTAGALLILGVLLGAVRADGGFTATSWGSATVALSVLSLGLVVHRGEVLVGRLDALAVVAFLLVSLWTALSLVWTSSVPLSALELEHSLLPVAALAAGVVVATGAAPWAPAVAVFGFGCTLALWGLASGVDAPLGYANALAIGCAVGILLAVGWAVEYRGRLAALGVIPPLCVLVVVLVRADSRGSWLALVGGLAVALALRSARPIVATGGALALTGLSAVLLALHTSAPRAAYWSATLHDIVRHPLVGSGAGTWRQVWLEYRDVGLTARNAHSLYLEVLSELGPVGLVLVVAALLVPLAAAVSARRRPYVPAVGSAYAALLVHFAVDWDWQINGVLLSAVLLGATLLAAAREVRPEPLLVVSRVVPLAGFAVLACAGALVWAQGYFIGQGASHLRAGAWAAALQDARRARWVAPWSAESWRIRGEAERAQGRLAAARRSFRRGVALDENDVELWRALSRVTLGVELRRVRERVEKLDPQSVERPPG